MLAQAVSGHAQFAPEDPRGKAQKAGVEFEAVLLNMVFGAVERSFSELPGAKLQQQTEAYGGFAMQGLTSGLARSGGIGLGKFITESLIKTAAKEKNAR